MTAITDKFNQATTTGRPSPAALTAVKTIGATSLTVDSTAEWPTDTAVHFIIYEVDANNDKIQGTQCDFKGIVNSATTINNLTLKAGTDREYPIGSKVIAAPTAAWADDVVEGLVVSLNQDGTIKDDAVTTNTILDGNVTTAKLADASVTNAKLATGAGEPGGAWTSWTPTITGFSADPAGGVYLYKQVGKTVFLQVRQPANGTSNSTSFSISLPVTAKTTTDNQWEASCRAVNNGSVIGGALATIPSGSTTLDLIPSATSSNWASSGGKRVIAAQIFYEAA